MVTASSLARWLGLALFEGAELPSKTAPETGARHAVSRYVEEVPAPSSHDCFPDVCGLVFGRTGDAESHATFTEPQATHSKPVLIC
jgi:hypothetical protein